MIYIATTDFSQGNKNVLNIPGGGMHIKRGTEVDLDFDLPITKLPKDEYLKYSVFFGQQPMLVPRENDEGRRIFTEVAAIRKAEKRSRAWSFEKWCMILGVVLTAAALLWAIIWGVFVWLKPSL